MFPSTRLIARRVLLTLLFPAPEPSALVTRMVANTTIIRVPMGTLRERDPRIFHLGISRRPELRIVDQNRTTSSLTIVPPKARQSKKGPGDIFAALRISTKHQALRQPMMDVSPDNYHQAGPPARMQDMLLLSSHDTLTWVHVSPTREPQTTRSHNLPQVSHQARLLITRIRKMGNDVTAMQVSLEICTRAEFNTVI